MYFENELPVESPMTGIPVEMPVDVLLAFPDYGPGEPAGSRFNLVGALATLLGKFGWEKAAKIIRPSIWARAWTDDELDRFTSAPFLGAEHAFSDVPGAELRSDAFLGATSESGRGRYVQHEVVHFFGRMGPPLTLDLGAHGTLEAGPLQYLLATARCRLLILRVEPPDVPAATQLASDIVPSFERRIKRGGFRPDRTASPRRIHLAGQYGTPSPRHFSRDRRATRPWPRDPVRQRSPLSCVVAFDGYVGAERHPAELGILRAVVGRSIPMVRQTGPIARWV